MALEQLSGPDDEGEEGFIREPFFMVSDSPQDNYEIDPLVDVEFKLKMAAALRSGLARERFRPRNRLGRFIALNILGDEKGPISLLDLVQASKLEAEAENLFKLTATAAVEEAKFIVSRYDMRS